LYFWIHNTSRGIGVADKTSEEMLWLLNEQKGELESILAIHINEEITRSIEKQAKLLGGLKEYIILRS